MANHDNGTPLSRLKAAVEQLTRAEAGHAEKAAALEGSRKEYERRQIEEAHAAKSVEAAIAAVKRAAREVE